jgi:long-subunit acyl-CoA synthetase (AMP-forming)
VSEAGGRPGLAAAQRFGLTILRLTVPANAPRAVHADRRFGRDACRATRCRLPTADDTALILHTSGTTSRPKIVPLLQSNIAASARNIRASLDLTPPTAA